MGCEPCKSCSIHNESESLLKSVMENLYLNDLETYLKDVEQLLFNSNNSTIYSKSHNLNSDPVKNLYNHQYKEYLDMNEKTEFKEVDLFDIKSVKEETQEKDNFAEAEANNKDDKNDKADKNDKDNKDDKDNDKFKKEDLNDPKNNDTNDNKEIKQKSNFNKILHEAIFRLLNSSSSKLEISKLRNSLSLTLEDINYFNCFKCLTKPKYINDSRNNVFYYLIYTFSLLECKGESKSYILYKLLKKYFPYNRDHIEQEHIKVLENNNNEEKVKIKEEKQSYNVKEDEEVKQDNNKLKNEDEKNNIKNHNHMHSQEKNQENQDNDGNELNHEASVNTLLTQSDNQTCNDVFTVNSDISNSLIKKFLYFFSIVNVEIILSRICTLLISEIETLTENISEGENFKVVLWDAFTVDNEVLYQLKWLKKNAFTAKVAITLYEKLITDFFITLKESGINNYKKAFSTVEDLLHLDNIVSWCSNVPDRTTRPIMRLVKY